MNLHLKEFETVAKYVYWDQDMPFHEKMEVTNLVGMYL
jgi:hypothetical protein